MSTSTERWGEGESPLLSVVQMREVVCCVICIFNIYIYYIISIQLINLWVKADSDFFLKNGTYDGGRPRHCQGSSAVFVDYYDYDTQRSGFHGMAPLLRFREA
jgi:hypothetical protein